MTPATLDAHLVLKLEDVVDQSVEPIGPQMRAVGRLDQLAGNAHPIAASAGIELSVCRKMSCRFETRLSSHPSRFVFPERDPEDREFGSSFAQPQFMPRRILWRSKASPGMAVSRRDRQFESPFLHRRV